MGDNVTDMGGMFRDASSFNQPLNDWRVDKVTDMGVMFAFASAFDQPLGDWRLRSDCDTRNMFVFTKFRNSRPVRYSIFHRLTMLLLLPLDAGLSLTIHLLKVSTRLLSS